MEENYKGHENGEKRGSPDSEAPSRRSDEGDSLEVEDILTEGNPTD
jgi:hypothetical protein